MKRKKILFVMSLTILLTGCGTSNQNNNDAVQMNGKNGVCIEAITLTTSEGNTDIYTITLTDGSTSIFKVTNGKDGECGHDGEKGDTGNGIEKIELTNSDGNTDTYTIFFTNGAISTFTVKNGVDGYQGVKGESGENGENGKSAFELFKEYHPEYTGSEEDWVNDIASGKFDMVSVSFDTNGGEIDGTSELQITRGTSIGENLPVPTKEGKEFMGWFTGWTANDIQITKNTPIYSDLTLIAKRDSYDINFLGNKNEILYSAQVNHGNKLVEPNDIPDVPNDIFFFDKRNFDFNRSIYSDIDIKSLRYPNDEFIISFGSYPQSVVSDEILKKHLSLLENGNHDGSVLEYDSNLDGVNEKYLCKRVTNKFTADDGSKINYGINYFKFEPIYWRILSKEENRYTLFSINILDSQEWNSYENYTYVDREEVRSNYEKATIRNFLNKYFYDLAFSEEEKSKIIKTTNENGLNSVLNKDNKYVCKNTNDKIYLLSEKELTEKPFCSLNGLRRSSDEVYDFELDALASDLAKASSDYVDDNGRMYWWTRSPQGYDSSSVWAVFQGELGHSCFCNYDYGVRPALKITFN